MNHTASASDLSTAHHEDAADLRTILAQLADDFEEFSQNQNMAAEGDLRRLCMAADVLRAMLKTSEDPAMTRENFFEAILDAADVKELVVEKDAQPQTLIPFFSGTEYIRPRPISMPSMPKVSPAWQQSHRPASPKSPSTTAHPYDPLNRVDRPPIPTPPRRPTPRARAGMAVAYPDGARYWTHNVFGRTLQSEVDAIAAQAAAEGVAVPALPGPRWNGRPRQFFVPVPWEGYGVWFDRDDEAGCEYQRQVEVFWEGVEKYWKEYPPREGEFNFGAMSENKDVDENQRKEETRVEEPASGLKDAENRDSTPVLGKRSRGPPSDNNDDNEDESRLDSSPPRPTKKLRSSPSLTLTIPPAPATLASPLAISPSSPLTPLPSRHSSPEGGPASAPAPASIHVPPPAASDAPAPVCARTTPTRARATRRSAAPPPESVRRSPRTAAKKSA